MKYLREIDHVPMRERTIGNILARKARENGDRTYLIFEGRRYSYREVDALTTRIANAPGYIKGVVNLRGVIVPIVDLRVRLGCAKAEYNHFTVVIVLNVKGRVVGAVVDSVSDVLELPAEAIRPAPPMASNGADNAYLTGIGSVGERMLILMDIEALMSSPDMGLLSDVR